MYYTFDVRITITESARRHNITDDEIRAVVSYPLLRLHLIPRREGADPYLFIGKFDEDEPLIEVIADLFDDPSDWVVFHAMMLRPQIVKNLQLEALIVGMTGDLASQRPERRGNS